MTASRRTREHFSWGGNCEGWRLVDHDDLSVIDEVVPPQAGESWHVHDRAQQFFYVLDGFAVLEQDSTAPITLAAHEGTIVAPGVAHRFSNIDDTVPLRLLIISTPASRHDRHDVAPSSLGTPTRSDPLAARRKGWD